MNIPHRTARGPFLTDGGLETSLVFLDGIDLPDFAAFPLVDTDAGRAALRRYFASYLTLAERLGLGFVLDTPTWRANADWGARRGYDAKQLAGVAGRSVALLDELVREHAALPIVKNGVVGPRGDGYVVGKTMTAGESAAYHALEVRALAEAGVDLISAITMTYAEEALGVVQAAQAVGLPVAVSFTVETDGRLPSGQALADAIAQVEAKTDGAPAYYLVNCAHPAHFSAALADGDGWVERVGGLRANASRSSHAELDAATDLDRGDVAELARLHRELAPLLSLRVVGGCCGTDLEHVEAIARALLTEPLLGSAG